MTVDAAAIPDVTTITADAIMDGELPCLEMAETAVPVFSGSSVLCAAVETIMAVAVITTDAAMTAAGSSSFFCFCVEMDAAATIADDPSERAEVISSALSAACFFQSPVFSFFLPDISDLSHKKHFH